MSSDNSFSLTTFSSSGKLKQLDYAMDAVEHGLLAVGVKVNNGVLLATRKKDKSTLVASTGPNKICRVTSEVGMLPAGLWPDAMLCQRNALATAAKYQVFHETPIPVRSLAASQASLMQEYTQSGGVRPFGVSLLVGGVTKGKPQLYQIDPSGTYYAWKACAIGSEHLKAREALQLKYTPNLGMEEAITLCLSVLINHSDADLTPTDVEVGLVSIDSDFRLLTPEELTPHFEAIQSGE